MRSSVKELMARWHDLMASPREAWERVLGRVRQRENNPQVLAVRELTLRAPLILQIETTNVCNASCVFCAYAGMKRSKGVMGLPLFRKVIEDYVAMGGGPVSLTPIMGDPLLDPHLAERLELLKTHPEISQITLTTNGIALGRYPDDAVRGLLESLDSIMVSIGGLDAEKYREMYGVDRFREVREATERLLRFRNDVARPAALALGFRTDDPSFPVRHRKEFREFRKLDVSVSHISNYANFSGGLQEAGDGKISLIAGDSGKRNTCIFPRISMCVCWDGTITACGCADFEGSALRIGNAESESLADVWHGMKRCAILESFPKERLSSFCRLCSAYLPDTIAARPYFRNLRPHQPLPLDFFRNFWGG